MIVEGVRAMELSIMGVFELIKLCSKFLLILIVVSFFGALAFISFIRIMAFAAIEADKIIEGVKKHGGGD